MPVDPTVRRWQKVIIRDAEKILGRRLTFVEERFVTSRGGFIALEMIHDTVKGSNPDDLERYLNSE